MTDNWTQNKNSVISIFLQATISTPKIQYFSIDVANLPVDAQQK